MPFLTLPADYVMENNVDLQGLMQYGQKYNVVRNALLTAMAQQEARTATQKRLRAKLEAKKAAGK